MAKPKRAVVHRPHLPKVRAVPEVVKCEWFATIPAYRCERAGYRRDDTQPLCDLHHAAHRQDPDQWAPEVKNKK